MTHILLGAILAVLVYTLIFRPWRAARRRQRDIRRGYEMLYPRQSTEPPTQPAESRWLFPVFVCLAVGVMVAAATMH
jgi:hypothetical protein